MSEDITIDIVGAPEISVDVIEELIEISMDSGVPGFTGSSAYEIWVEAGNEGTEEEFLESLNGTDGVNGTDGADGDPAPDTHNDLNGIQGGSATERFHLTQAEKTVVENTSGVNTGDQDLTAHELISNKSEEVALGSSDELYPTQNAVKTYLDNNIIWKAVGEVLEPKTLKDINLGGSYFSYGLGDSGFQDVPAARFYYSDASGARMFAYDPIAGDYLDLNLGKIDTFLFRASDGSLIMTKEHNQKLILGVGGASSIGHDGTSLNMSAPTDGARLTHAPTGAESLAVATTGYVDDGRISDAEQETLDNTSGINTGDQDISGLATKDEVAELHSRVGFTARDSGTAMSARVFTTVLFATQEEDTHDAWNGAVFTAPVAGLYEVIGHATFASITSGNRAIVGIEKNGSLTDGGLLGRGANGSTTLGGFGGGIRLFLDVGDEIEMVAYCDNATSLYNINQKGYSTFSCYLMK